MKLNVLDSCIDKDNPKKYEDISAHDFLVQRLKEIEYCNEKFNSFEDLSSLIPKNYKSVPPKETRTIFLFKTWSHFSVKVELVIL